MDIAFKLDPETEFDIWELRAEWTAVYEICEIIKQQRYPFEGIWILRFITFHIEVKENREGSMQLIFELYGVSKEGKEVISPCPKYTQLFERIIPAQFLLWAQLSTTNRQSQKILTTPK